jgi:hypothetical protein
MPFAKAAAALVAAAPLFAPRAALPPTGGAGSAERIVMVVDRDDEDADGVPDREQASKIPEGGALHVVLERPARTADAAQWEVPAADGVRVIADGAPVAKGLAIPPRTKVVALQATKPGVHRLTLFGRALEVHAFELRAVDGAGKDVDFTRSHASFQRTPPDRLAADPYAPTGDPDALRFVAIGPAADIPTTLTFLAITDAGAPVDVLSDVPLGEIPCPPDAPADMTCGSTPPIRLVADDIDRAHPLAKQRSVKGVLGGAIVLQTSEGERLQSLRAGGPRATSAGAIDRYRANLRMILVRSRAGGPPPLGGDDAGALLAARAEIERAGLLWSACGIGFGPTEQLSVTIVDPPRAHLVAVGCDHGFPASGGAIRVRADGHEVTAKVARGMTPVAAARVLAGAIAAVGLTARVSENASMNDGAGASADVLVRRKDGTLAQIEGPTTGAVSTDATLTACVGRVDLTDGLTHFGDTDAFAGTVEERTLLKAFDDGDPTTIEIFFVPGFAEGGRVGESFIMADRSAVRNAVIEDRAAIRSDRASFALAHELGHVLMDEPGHPDDFGPDTPTRLMDADAANPTAFGPRRLTLDECARALRQSGPTAPVVLLKPWPFARIPSGR